MVKKFVQITQREFRQKIYRRNHKTAAPVGSLKWGRSADGTNDDAKPIASEIIEKS